MTGTCRQLSYRQQCGVFMGLLICSIAILNYSIDQEWPMQAGADPTKMSVGVNFQGNVGASDKVNISFFTQDFRKSYWTCLCMCTGTVQLFWGCCFQCFIFSGFIWKFSPLVSFHG